jgi:hypothetical protein
METSVLKQPVSFRIFGGSTEADENTLTTDFVIGAP